MAALKVVKKEFRQRIRRALSSVSDESIVEQTSNAVKTLLATPHYQKAKAISVYLSMPNGEISTKSIVQDALKQGKSVFIPYTYKTANPQRDQPTSVMDMVELLSWEDYESLKPDSWGIPTPSAESLAERRNNFGEMGLTQSKEMKPPASNLLDLIVMPGMAFDSSMGRLGHGKGFYDFFLARIRQHGERWGAQRLPTLVGMALNEQLLPGDETVPMDATDYRVDALVTGDGKMHHP
ncbi:5-formyltetrahydrofolate cyclo-ligase-like protein [Aulographum hederae CBS 113979]|uniref:5-formyltetrahydrofolate cyclo-ligase n=1 Tax=Aulographum hederae CBS 113979 TaxID=1176131 RepID=A0A6G1GP97_9PEZI|nr:5-formyltetrahydrofolate cyclo-ligase-like protein [Aulographum hederae CBS 113979]